MVQISHLHGLYRMLYSDRLQIMRRKRHALRFTQLLSKNLDLTALLQTSQLEDFPWIGTTYGVPVHNCTYVTSAQITN